MELRLKGTAGALVGHVVSLHQDRPTYIGHGPENDVVLADKNVARRHAMVVVTQTGHLLCSLTSRKGVRVNGYRTLNVELQPADILAFGEHMFLVESTVSEQSSELIASQPTGLTEFEQETDIDLLPRAYLNVIDGDLAGQSFPLYEDTTAHLGRGSECDIVFRSKRVSRRQFQLAVSPDNFLLRDFESTNGTRVNNRRVTEHRLRSGDEISFGGQTIRFEELPSTDDSEFEAEPDGANPRTPGVRCPGRCGRIYPFGLEHCPLDGALLVNGRTALS